MRCMPLDVVKTRMQSLEACALYRNSFHCADLIFTEESILSFWTGTTPRLAQLLVVTSEDIYVDHLRKEHRRFVAVLIGASDKIGGWDYLVLELVAHWLYPSSFKLQGPIIATPVRIKQCKIIASQRAAYFAVADSNAEINAKSSQILSWFQFATSPSASPTAPPPSVVPPP